jgi:hypothetical protein
MKFAAAALILPLLAGSGCGGYASSAPGPAVPASQLGASYTYNGTVHTVRAEAGSLDLITGVGPALRMIHMTVPPSAKLEAAGKRVALSDLKPGEVIHAECRLTAQGMVAEAIRVLPVAQTQGPGPA